MAGGLVKYRRLDRPSAHRKALLRNLVTSLVKDESIHTTWHKAKEAQRLAEKLITYAKRNNEETRRKAHAILFTPDILMPKLFGPLKERYAVRPSGYTRVLRTEPKGDDQAASAILELVDGPRDMRFAMTAATVARDRMLGQPHTELTRRNMKKVTEFHAGGLAAFEEMVEKTAALDLAAEGRAVEDLNPYDVKEFRRYMPTHQKPRHNWWVKPGDQVPQEDMPRRRLPESAALEAPTGQRRQTKREQE